jgi:hypothetical protein
MLEQEIPQRGGDRHSAATGPRLQGDLPVLLIPAALDSNHPVGKVDVLRPESLQLAAAQPRVHSGRPDRSVCLRESAYQRFRFGG